jgi:recombination protein RecR
MHIESLESLIKLFAKLPGLGPRSARRIVLHLIKSPESLMTPLASEIQKAAREIKKCQVCGNIDLHSPCSICSDSKRDHALVCVVEDITDLWAIERGGDYKGVYHVLGGRLSALDGITADKLNLEGLSNRVANDNIREVIIATNATLEGQTTSFYIADILKPFNVKASRLAHGIPVGAELDYMDEGTLTLALKMRQNF